MNWNWNKNYIKAEEKILENRPRIHAAYYSHKV